MTTCKLLTALTLLATLSLPVSANGFGEDRAYQFTTSFFKQYQLNFAIAYETNQLGTLGAGYVSNTSIGNQVIIGDNTTVTDTTIGQKNKDSQQNAVGASLEDSASINVGVGEEL